MDGRWSSRTGGPGGKSLKLGPCSVCAIDLGVDGAVVVTQAEDSVSCIRQDRGERVSPAPPWTIKHLRLKLAKLMLQVRELVRKGLNDRWVPYPEGCLIRGPEVLGSLQGCNIVRPESGLLGEGDVLGVRIEGHRFASLVEVNQAIKAW